jgi:hypothetical protein
LVANIIAGEVVEPLRRTVVFGMLQGCIMLGQAIGYLSKPPSPLAPLYTPLKGVTGGGMIGDAWGIRRPFEVAFYSFLISTMYVRIAIPYIAAESLSSGSKSDSKGLAGFFAPLRVLAPQKVILASGVMKKHYGVVFLCSGVFLGVVSFTRPRL